MLKFINRRITEKDHEILVDIFFIDLGIVLYLVEEGDLSGWATKAKWQKSSECGRACRRSRSRRRRRRMRGGGEEVQRVSGPARPASKPIRLSPLSHSVLLDGLLRI